MMNRELINRLKGLRCRRENNIKIDDIAAQAAIVKDKDLIKDLKQGFHELESKGESKKVNVADYQAAIVALIADKRRKGGKIKPLSGRIIHLQTLQMRG